MPKAKNRQKMITVEQKAVGKFNWDDAEQARIERNLFVLNGRTREALRFCKNRNGRHNRVHLVIQEEDFVELFQDAVKNGVFSPQTLQGLRAALGTERDPFLDVIGIGADGKLASDIDEDLYGDEPA
ncbi:MAG TPA: hypothetical protein VEU52_05295 [Candidatus Limnocylindrales bacterium]|nr:hypothetical protein [Candidatus Limnocylindrales bacterium]